MNRFGESAPAEELFEKFGFTVANVVKRAQGVLSRPPRKRRPGRWRKSK